MSPGRVECGPGMFSTAGATARSGVPGASRATVAMAEITVHAPVLSIFISSIRSDGLMLIPPESKQTPLPTIARCRPSASRSPSPPERMTIIRGGLSLPRPTAMNMPMPISVALLGVDDVDPQAVLLGDGARLVGEDRRADVVRGAVREGPCDVRALGDDDAALGGLGQGRGVGARRDRGSARRGPAAPCRPRRDRSSAGRRCPRRRRGRSSSAATAASPSTPSTSGRARSRGA